MFCIKCGAQIQEDAKFCAFCGTDISKITIKSDEVREEETEEEIEVVEFELFDRSMEVNAILEGYSITFKAVVGAADILCNSFHRKLYDEINSIDDFMEIGVSEIVDAINKIINHGVKLLVANEVEHIDFDTLYNLAYKYIDPTPVIAPYIERAEAIEKLADEICEMRNIQRSARAKWYGGGFGIKGALKGAIQAGVLNAGTSVIYGIENLFQDSRDKKRIEEAKEKAFTIKEDAEKIVHGLYKCCIGVFYAVCEILVKEKILAYYDFDTEKADKILKNYRQFYAENPEKYTEAYIDKIIACIEINPFNVDYYIELYDCIKDKDIADIHHYLEFAEFFYVDAELKRQLNTMIFLDVYSEINEKEIDTVSECQKYREWLDEIEEKFPFVVLDSFYEELEEREEEIEEGNTLVKSFGEEFYSMDALDEVIKDINRAISEKDYECIYNYLKEKHGFVEYYFERNVVEVIFANQIADYKEKEMLEVAKEFKGLKCQDSNFFQYMADCVEYSLYKAAKSSEGKSSHRDSAYYRMEAHANNKQLACSSAVSLAGFENVKNQPYDRGLEQLLYGAKKCHPLALSWLGSFYYEGKKGLSQNAQKARFLFILGAVGKHPYGLKYSDKLQLGADKMVSIVDMSRDFFDGFMAYCTEKTKEVIVDDNEHQEVKNATPILSMNNTPDAEKISQEDKNVNAKIVTSEPKKEKWEPGCLWGIIAVGLLIAGIFNHSWGIGLIGVALIIAWFKLQK